MSDFTLDPDRNNYLNSPTNVNDDSNWIFRDESFPNLITNNNESDLQELSRGNNNKKGNADEVIISMKE